MSTNCDSRAGGSLGRAAGFTLIELLVVIAILAILIGLLLTAVQKVRAAAARATCQNSLKQIALAAHNFESTTGVLPPGVYGDPPTGAMFNLNYQYYGVLVPLLPYLEQSGVFDSFRSSFNPSVTATGQPWIYYPDAYAAAQTKIKTFLCPADGGQDSVTVGTVLLIWPYSCGWDCGEFWGVWYTNDVLGPRVLGKSNYAGVAGGCGRIGNLWDPWRGLFTTQSRNTLGTVTDGTSQTLFFGETLGGSDGPSRDLAVAWMSAGQLPVRNEGLPTDGNAQWWDYSSRHTGVVNFAYADGSVKPLRKGCDARVLRSAAGWADGETYNSGALTN